MSTIVDITGLEIPDEVDGRSLRPLFEGDDLNDWCERVCCEYHGDEFGRYSQRMIRTHEHKYVDNGSDVNELYDPRHDFHELNKTEDPIGVWTQKILGGDADVES